MRFLLITGLIITANFLCMRNLTIAYDLPHRTERGIECGSCHTPHKASGTSLSKYATNYNLCISACHTGTNRKPFAITDQAIPRTWLTTGSGTSHRWDSFAAMPQQISPDANSKYGLRWTSFLSNSELRRMLLTKFDNVVVCSVCHTVHSQANSPWDPYGGWYTGAKGGDSGEAAGGTLNSIWTTGKSYWDNWGTSAWKDFYVKMTKETAINRSNAGQIRQISSNWASIINFSTNWTTVIESGDKYEIAGRHFQRVANNVDDLCEDCHYFRSAAWATSVRTWTSNYQSHPVGKIFTNDAGRDVWDTLQFNNIPLEPVSAGWTTQAGSRYELNGVGDTNVTNNIVLDSSKKVRCMSCHGIHYTDSSAGTIDAP